eukprot:m.75426 g.75426  ORF g.75426 m.75426 type:complete len:68 (-) comp11843_c0_seq15:748-951(-)
MRHSKVVVVIFAGSLNTIATVLLCSIPLNSRGGAGANGNNNKNNNTHTHILMSTSKTVVMVECTACV